MTGSGHNSTGSGHSLDRLRAQKLRPPSPLGVQGPQLRRLQHIAHDRIRATRADVSRCQIDQGLYAVAPAEQIEQVQHNPSEPRQHPLELEPERDLQDSIAKMPADDRAMAERVHTIVTESASALVPKTYYGMPAYATEGKNGKVICFFKPKSKFRVRYSTFGFQPDAHLDDGAMWATEFAVIKLTPAVEARIAELAKKGAG